MTRRLCIRQAAQISAERFKDGVFGKCGMGSHTIRFALQKGKLDAGGYATAVHETTHLAESYGAFDCEDVLKAAAKGLGLRINSNKFSDLKLRTVGLYRFEDAKVPSEVVAYAVEREMTRNGNQLTTSVLNVMKEMGVIK